MEKTELAAYLADLDAFMTETREWLAKIDTDELLASLPTDEEISRECARRVLEHYCETKNEAGAVMNYNLPPYLISKD